VMSKVKHSNIVTFLGACMIPPNLCFIMELCESSLFDIIHVNKTQFTMQDNFQIMVNVVFMKWCDCWIDGVLNAYRLPETIDNY